MKKWKKFAKNKIQSESLAKQVRNRIKTTIWEKQNVREGFQETYKPLIEKFEKPKDDKTKNIFTQNEGIIKNQLALTAGVRANQRAITDTLQRIADNNERLPDMRDLKPPDNDENKQPEQPRRPRNYNLERSFDGNDLDLIRRGNYPRPLNFAENNIQFLEQVREDATNDIRILTGQINGRNRKLNPDVDYMAETERLKFKLKSEKRTIFKCSNRLDDYFRAINYEVVGEGIFPVNPNQLINSLKLLGGSIIDGNIDVVPEFMGIAHRLNKMKVLPSKELKDLLKKMRYYVSY